MPLSESPRKVVPLALPSDSEPSSRRTTITKRMFFCGVVVENEPGQPLPEDVQDLVASFGDRISSYSDGEVLPAAPSEAGPSISNPNTRKPVTTDASPIQDVINELVSTERSYVKRLRILKYDYADPLRSFARSRDTAIIPPYEAKTLFGNVDNLLPVNERFLEDLEKMVADDGPETVGYVGDVALRHFKELRGFDQYRTYYTKREEAQLIFEREMAKRGSGFASYVDRIKYSSTDSKNRVGLRELLMDPVQRIPRYTLLFRTMIKRMHPNDPQLAKLLEADEIASKIALAEMDVSTVRASVLSSLSTTIDGFPPNIYSNGRQFIDCIDVEDLCTDGLTPGTLSSANPPDPLPCSLFLFDDKIAIVKRPSDKGAKGLAGLNQLDRMVLTPSTRSNTSKKTGLSYKGIFGITQVVATDVGNAEFHLYLENPPQDQSDRWAGRPFRAYTVAIPPAPANLDPTRARSVKEKFLEKLWNAQALHRTKLGQSVVLLGAEREVESRGGRVTKARTYFNVYEHTPFLREVNKTKVVVHIDVTGIADPIPFGIGGPPMVVIRVQPMAGEVSRYSVTSYVPNEEPEDEEIVHTMRIPERVVHTIHQYGLFKFQTGKNSIPTTPTATSRSKAAIFGLDVLSRNLWHAIPGSSKGDIFGGSVNSHRRAKSTISRSSMYTQSTQTTADSLRSSARSASTAGTSLASEDGESIVGKPSRRTRNVLRRQSRSKSPGDTMSEPESSTPKRPTQSHGRSQSFSGEDSLFDDEMTDPGHLYRREEEEMDQSEWDLTQRLELARRNSRNQHGEPPLSATSWEKPIEDTIYEEEPPQGSLRPLSRASVLRVSTPTPRPTTPDLDTETPRRPRSGSQYSLDDRPRGPRIPSPLPPSLYSRPSSQVIETSDDDEGDEDDLHSALDHTLVNINKPIVAPTASRSRIPRPGPDPFDNTQQTSRPRSHTFSRYSSSVVEPLSIKKKGSVRDSTDSSVPSLRRPYVRTSPKAASSSRLVSERRVSPPQIRRAQTTGAQPELDLDLESESEVLSQPVESVTSVDVERLLSLSGTAKEDMLSSRKAIKRIKTGTERIRATSPLPAGPSDDRPQSPGLRQMSRIPPPRHNPPPTKAAQERLEEMRNLISRRVAGDGPNRARSRSVVESAAPASTSSTSLDEQVKLIDDAAGEAEKDLVRAISNHEALETDLRQLVENFREQATLVARQQFELRAAARQRELLKTLLRDVTLEKEFTFDAFNDELAAFFEHANLPADEAWDAMVEDLQRAMEHGNAVDKENFHLRLRLQEMESEKEEWAALLREHGLMS